MSGEETGDRYVPTGFFKRKQQQMYQEAKITDLSKGPEFHPKLDGIVC
jgi:hypothetical protein